MGMEKSAKSFKAFYEASFMSAGHDLSRKLADEFINDFIYYTPIKLEVLQSYLNVGQIDTFYNSLGDLKYLIEFSDNLSRYWYLLRGYSGALAKLKANQNVKGSKKLYGYYFEKYGDRRSIRHEHWFERKRWEFLDELNAIFSDDDLEIFVLKYQRVLAENMEIYVSFVMAFINDLKKLQHPSSSSSVAANKKLSQ